MAVLAEKTNKFAFLSVRKFSKSNEKPNKFGFSEMQPIFETSLKDNGNLLRIQIFEIFSFYGLIEKNMFEGFDTMLILTFLIYFVV